MKLGRKRRYYFSDTSIASDTVISFVMCFIALLIEIVSFIASITTRGKVPDIFGNLLLCAIVLSFFGEIFAVIGNKSQEGGMKGKRISILLNIFTFILPICMLII